MRRQVVFVVTHKTALQVFSQYSLRAIKLDIPTLFITFFL